MAIDKIFNDANVDGIADNIFGAVNNSVSEVKAMQQRKAAENVQMVIEAFKKIESNITEKFDNVSDVIEKRVLTIKDGRDGLSGSDGRNGRDGKPGRDGVNGKQGTPGTPGKDGVDGEDGVSVTNANIDFDGSLIISLSSGQQINVGEIVPPELEKQIKVISTMSTNGAVGIKDEGTSITAGVKVINFVGAAVTATNSGDDVTVNVSAGTGTVTSVAATVPAFLSVAGSPVTTTGTLAISLSGTALPVANGGTGVTTSTGTTNVVLSNSPTLVTPALGTPSSGVVTNLTGTASININGTVGATTANTGAFTTLSATGVTTVQAGTAAAPAITTTGDTNTGIFFPAADTVAASVGGTEGMRLTSTGLGIGTSSPAGKLSVNVDASTELITLRSSSGRQIFSHEPGGNARPLTIKAQTLTYADDTATRLTVDASGNLGLGVTPSAWDSTFKALESGFGSTNGGSFFVQNNGDYTASIATNLYYNAGWKYKNSAPAARYEVYQNKHQWFTAPSGTADNAITFTQAMTLDASGNLLVGTTSVGFTNSRSFTFQGVGDGKVYVNHSTANINGDGYIGFGYNGSQIGSITQNGTTAVAYNTSSDYRLKENIQPMTGALAKVAALKPCTYNWKADGSDGEGFIAHELAEVCPSAVVGEKDAVDADGKPQYQGIDTSFLVATLTAAIQELKAEFDAYKATHP